MFRSFCISGFPKTDRAPISVVSPTRICIYSLNPIHIYIYMLYIYNHLYIYIHMLYIYTHLYICMYAYVYIIKIWYLLVSNSIVGEFPVQSGCTLWLAPGWRDPGGDGIRMWKMDEHGDWLEHILCILTHINVTENIGTSLEFTSINIGNDYGNRPSMEQWQQ